MADGRSRDGAANPFRDPTLYRGSAGFYDAGRIPYPPELVGAVRTEVPRLADSVVLDVGCGPGTLALLLAPSVREITGIDADADMVREARRLAQNGALRNTRWRTMYAEELPGDLPEMDVITFAQSFHWMDRPAVAASAHTLLRDGGTLIHVHGITDRGTDEPVTSEHPRPPYGRLRDVVESYLGPRARAGQGYRPRMVAGVETGIYEAAGFVHDGHVRLPTRDVTRTADEVVSSIYSLSSSAPHLFGDRFARVDAELRAVLGAASPAGVFAERTAPIELDFWRR